ncbi:MAG: glycoside hydrolase 43 family protein [Acidobacteria bacterium]|nr:glycoside hydrolase 43 family protein [Acidobacteriota bacterium]
MKKTCIICVCHALFFLLVGITASSQTSDRKKTWTADNGNGTFTNPLFYEEFSDPDMIRVGEYFYLTGTTMHSMPGLPILRSRDLVNWQFVAYAMDKLDLGPAFRLDEGKNVYGRGIWAPSFRYHNGTYYIFSNVNGQTTQKFTATNPAGPWTRTPMKVSLHDLSVLFDDDGKVYVVWGYEGIRLAQLNRDLTDLVPGTERLIIPKGLGIGEGAHFYKINGKYLITSAWYMGAMRMPAARADRPEGPYEYNQAISIDEDFGLMKGKSLTRDGKILPADPAARGRMSLHQGGIIQTTKGEWWGFSMMDYNSIGRLTSLSPITWQDGWPYFGLPGNLKRTPRTWVKPNTGYNGKPTVPYDHNDDFIAPKLKPIWQWNHVPVDDKWSLSERVGFLRLHTLPATNFWQARNTLTQRAIGPLSSPIVKLDVASLQTGDVAGLALLNKPYAWIGIERDDKGISIAQYSDYTAKTARASMTGASLWLKADCDFLKETAQFSFSLDGKSFTPLGEPVELVFQLTTFQGVRYSLFAYNSAGQNGGYADFDSMMVNEPHPRGLMRPIPYGKQIRLTSFRAKTGLTVQSLTLTVGMPTAFTVADMKLGRVALKSGRAYISINRDGQTKLETAKPGLEQSFQWIETPTGELVLMSLASNRFLRIDPKTQAILCDSAGPVPDGSDGTRFVWELAVK